MQGGEKSRRASTALLFGKEADDAVGELKRAFMRLEHTDRQLLAFIRRLYPAAAVVVVRLVSAVVQARKLVAFVALERAMLRLLLVRLKLPPVHLRRIVLVEDDLLERRVVRLPAGEDMREVVEPLLEGRGVGVRRGVEVVFLRP